MVNHILFSLVIPAFNRAYCIERSIKSAQYFLASECSSEIIVVDDGSTDDTIVKVENLISGTKEGPQITLVKHVVNKGVCAAKNTGARLARGEWIIFLDSDDELIPESFMALKSALKKQGRNPLHFFSCISNTAGFVNNSDVVIKRDLNEYLLLGTSGEKLPVVKRVVFSDFPYDEDMPGYEGLAYMRIIKKYGFACIYKINVRRYYEDGQDRLSSFSNMKKRSAILAKGHLRVLREHSDKMNSLNIIRQCLKWFKSLLVSVI